MKNVFKLLILAFGMLVATASFADAVYPYTNPTYIPTAVSPAVSYSAPADYVMTTNGLATASVRITGTCTSLAGALQGTNDGSNWSNIDMSPVGGGANSFSVSAPGFWRADVSGYTKVRMHITALTAACSVSMAGTVGQGDLAVDPCQDATVMKSSAAVAVGASTTSALVAAVTGKSVYMCSFAASAVGTNPTMTLKYGTQTTNPCDTGATNLTGAVIPAAADGMVNMGVGSTVASAPVSNQLCLTTGATTSIQGVVTYVQQ